MPISKVEAARRQLDTAIDLYFEGADSLSAYTLAFASFKILFDLYPHHQHDGFAAQIDAMISKEGWRSMTGVANFLKHSDRDPDGVLEAHHPEESASIIGFATLLYRRIAEDFSPKMRAFDIWIEQEAHDELGIVEVDENEGRAAEHKRIRDAARALPYAAKMAFARKQYHLILENYERWSELAKREFSEGLSVTEVLDRRENERRG